MEGGEVLGEAPPDVQQDGGDTGHVTEVNHVVSDGTQLDLAQLPVEALLSALKNRPESELREASNKLAVIGAKVGAKIVTIRQTGAKSAVDKQVRPKPEIRTACGQCRRTHMKCDANRPCSRCVNKGWSQECSFEVDDEVPMPKNTNTRSRKKPPITKPGYSASGDKLCEHGIEMRYCLHPTCVQQGGGKAMCKHGKRKRSCTEPECVSETEERRRQIQGGRCKHGVQMRCCTQEECRIDFQMAGHQYRERLKERKRGCLGEPGDCSDRPKPKRGRPPGQRGAGHMPRLSGADGAGESSDMHDGADGADKAAAAAAVMALSVQDTVNPLVSLAPVHDGGMVHSAEEIVKQRALLISKTTLMPENHVSALVLAADDARQANRNGDGGEHAPADLAVAHDGAGAETLGEDEGGQKPDEVQHEEDKGAEDMQMNATHEHVDVVDAAQSVPPLEGEDGADSMGVGVSEVSM